MKVRELIDLLQTHAQPDDEFYFAVCVEWKDKRINRLAFETFSQEEAPVGITSICTDELVKKLLGTPEFYRIKPDDKK